MVAEFLTIGQSKSLQRKVGFTEMLLFPLFLLISTFQVSGQEFKAYKDLWINESREFLLNNQKPLPYLQSGFYHFSGIQDEALTEGLESNWEKFAVVPATPVPKSRKFEVAPLFDFEGTSYHNPQSLSCFTAENSEISGESAIINPPRIRKPEYTTSNPQKLNFRFYGNLIQVTCDRLLSLPVNQPFSKDLAVEYWKKFQVANSHHLVGQLMAVRDRLGLNDWGFFLLVKACSNAIYPSDENGATLLCWGLMIRSGFDVKIGFNQLGSTVLYRTTSTINGVPSVKINGNLYYIDKPISSFPLFSFSPTHPGAAGTIHLNFNQSLNFQGEIQFKKIQFQWGKKMLEFNLKYNPEVIRFLEEYPQTYPELYFNAPFSYAAGESLLKQFRPVLAAMSKEEGAAFLQQFVQKSFAYRPYNDLFGYDRFMFPEELLFKDDSNDKGKSMLYAWLVTNLLNGEAALLEFPGWYSVAISLGQPMEGDNYFVAGKSYTIADPTYENAPLGLVMKEFYQVNPIARVLRNVFKENSKQDKIWRQALAFGAERSGSGVDYIMDESGNSYITGFYHEKNSKAGNSLPAPFIARFNADNSLAWMTKFTSSGSAFGLELKQLEKNEFYIAGSFRGLLECNGKKIQSEPADPDLFFAQFNQQGELGWLTKSGLDDLEEDTKLFYVARFTRSGAVQSLQLANEDERTGRTGFQPCDKDGLSYIASRYQTTGLDKSSDEVLLKSITIFRKNLNRLKQMGIEPGMAFIASLFNVMIISGNQLTGQELSTLKDEKAGHSMPEFYDKAQSLRLLKNNNGIAEIFTSNSQPIKISGYKISDRCRLKIIPLDNNDLKINVIDGIELETGSGSLTVNSLILDLSSGNLLLDLGKNHLLVSRNLSREIPK